MTDPFAPFYSQVCDVDTLTSVDTLGGHHFTPHRGVPCWVNEETQLVRDAAGVEVTSSSQINVALPDCDWFTPRSVVTYDGRKGVVLRVSRSALGQATDGGTVYLQ